MNAEGRPESRLLVLLGPTGTGKSAAAVRVARTIDGEIIGCDALQVYRSLDAATAKPTAIERDTIRHHLVDCVDPRTDYTMADYVRAAERAIFEVAKRGRVPLVVGGTGLYLRGLLRGVIEAPARDPKLRDRLHRIVERGGAGRLHAWLRRRDPDSAGRIAPADVQRLVRAVELARSGGVTWGERLKAQGTWDSRRERYRSLKIGLDMDRELLNARLDERVDRFFEAGLVREVRRLLEDGLPAEANALKAIGYREVLAALRRGEDPENVREDVRRNTRRFAKRQRTWYRTEPDVTWLDAKSGIDAVAEKVAELWHEKNSSILP